MTSSTSFVYIVGTRPNFVKMAPVVGALRRGAPLARHVVVHTGQHYDRQMYEIFFKELGLDNPDYALDVGSGRHGEQTARALERVESVLLRVSPSVVLVPGDVNSTLGAGLAAVKLEIPIAHVEAGLRSFDRSMPEEVNRVLVDQISTWCMTHSPEAGENLLREGVPADRVFMVGNTMIDTLVRMRPVIAASGIIERLRLSPQSYILVTLHRPGLVESALFESVLDQLVALTKNYDVVFPVHPRSRVHVPSRKWPSRLHLLDPVGYVDFVALEQYAAGVLTDSGGVQEETTFLGVPCFTLRSTTERPITVTSGTNRILGLNPEAIADLPALLEERIEPRKLPTGWDGRASERLAEILLSSPDIVPRPFLDDRRTHVVT